MSNLKKDHGKNVAFKTKSYLPCGTKFLRIGDFLCFAGTNLCDYDRLVFLAGN